MRAHDVVHVHHVTEASAEAAQGVALLPPHPVAPPAPVVAALSVMMMAVGAGWGVYFSAGERLFDAQGALVLVMLSVVAGAGVMYGHAVQRPVVVRE